MSVMEVFSVECQFDRLVLQLDVNKLRKVVLTDFVNISVCN